MKKNGVFIQSIFLILVCISLYGCSAACVLDGRIPCGGTSVKRIPLLEFTEGFTVENLRNSEIRYFVPNDNFRQKVETVKLSDASIKIRADFYGAAYVEFVNPETGWFKPEYDWEVVAESRPQPYKVTKITYKSGTCCFNNRPTKVYSFESCYIGAKIFYRPVFFKLQ
jgi:hypothetical protein